jgi:hypothetical protein
LVAVTAVAQVARLAPFLEVLDFEALQLRSLTEAVCATVGRRLDLDCFLGECLAGAEVTGAGLGVTGALATGVGAGVGETGVATGGAVETGAVVVGGVVVGGVLVGGVVVGGVGPVVVVPEPLHRPSAQHGSTTRSLLSGMPGPAMIQRFSGE